MTSSDVLPEYKVGRCGVGATRPRVLVTSVFVLLLLGALFLSWNCKSNPVDVETPMQFYPLSAGNWWLYIVWRYHNGSPWQPIDTIVTRITSEMSVTFEGNLYNVGIQDSRWLYWNGPDGLYHMGGVAETDTLLMKRLFLKYPVTVGDAWDDPTIAYNNALEQFIPYDTLRWTCVGVSEPLSTPAGTYECIVYHYRMRPEPDVLGYWNIYEYYVPGLGRAGELVKQDDGTISFGMFLYQYEVTSGNQQ